VCFVRFLKALHRHMNLERRGQMRIGPFTFKAVPSPLPGAANGLLTRIDETRLARGGAIRVHIFRDIFGFTSGPAEIELEAIGFSHPVAEPTEVRALHLLLARAAAHAV
jgi:hypothetical protein